MFTTPPPRGLLAGRTGASDAHSSSFVSSFPSFFSLFLFLRRLVLGPWGEKKGWGVKGGFKFFSKIIRKKSWEEKEGGGILLQRGRYVSRYFCVWHLQCRVAALPY